MSLTALCASLWGLSALRVAVESELLTRMAAGESDPPALASAAQLDPMVTLRILEALEAHGFAARTKTGSGEVGFVLSTEGAQLASRAEWLRADLAATFGQTNAFITASRSSDLGGGWQPVDPEVVRSQSAMSRMVSESSMGPLLASLPAMERLARPGAAFLDVGAGAASVAITFCKRFPTLRAVGLEPLRTARLEAQSAITLAGLSDRIEMRPTRIEALADLKVYDAAFVASAFIDDAALAKGLGHVSRAVVPGGLVLLGAWRTPDNVQIAAASKLRWQLWGGGTRSPADVVHLAKNAGLVDVREMPSQGAVVPVVARTPG